MRGWLMVSVLALAGCGEHRGWNPNYQFGADPYGQYRIAREAALVSGGDFVQTVPVALPVHAPTAAEIAGRDPVPAPPTMGLPATRVPAASVASRQPERPPERPVAAGADDL